MRIKRLIAGFAIAVTLTLSTAGSVFAARYCDYEDCSRRACSGSSYCTRHADYYDGTTTYSHHGGGHHGGRHCR